MSAFATLNPLRHKALVWSLSILGLVTLLGLMAWSLVTSFDNRMQQGRHQAERELQAIGHLQTQSVAAWREQRMADAWSLLDDPLFSAAVADWSHATATARTTKLQQRLRILQERAKYEAVYLVDVQGQRLLSVNDSSTQKLPASEQQALQVALAQAAPVAIEPRVDPIFAFPFFSVLAPLYDGMQAIGAVWLVSDVRSTLYPMLNQWPIAIETAESSIIMRQGDEFVYLSPLRHAANATLNARSLLTRSSDPAVQAILNIDAATFGLLSTNSRPPLTQAIIEPVSQPWW